MLLENGFSISYEIKRIRSIKVVPSGDFNGNKYTGSIQFTTWNLEQIEDDELGIIDKETNLIFRIPCEDKDLKKFNLFLREKIKNGEVLNIFAGIPRPTGKDTYQVGSFETAEEIMKRFEQSPKKK